MSRPIPRDQDITLAVPGQVETVRPRLIEALQRLGYKVFEGQPLHARRGGQGLARWDSSLNVLDYPTNLTISLKQTNDVALTATFSYEVKSCIRMTKGDRQTLVREAQAIAALAGERLAISACPSCGVPVTDDSHFCRRCGAPLVLDVAELEVLRVTKGARSSYHNIFLGLLTLTLSLLSILGLLLIINTKVFTPLLWAVTIFASYGFFTLLSGVWQLHRTLNPAKSSEVNSRTQTAFTAAATTALPSPPGQTSITEGTTELLLPAKDRRVPNGIRRRNVDTAEVDDEHLM